MKRKNNFFKKLKNPYIISEIGVNHENSLKKAYEMIMLSKRGGADAVKFQSYKAENLASKFSPAYWDLKKEKTNSQFKLLKKYDKFNVNEYYKLAAFCKKKKLDFLSTPFDHESADYLSRIVPFFKISSSDITNLPLLKHIGEKRKPVLISTGASNLLEIKKASKILKMSGATDISIMHCVLNYPTSDENANLKMICHLQKHFQKTIIGYSDHTFPDKEMTSLTTAFLLGAKIIEKHFTHNKKLKGNDHYHAMDFKDLKNFVKKLKKIKEKIGTSKNKKSLKSENISRINARRSIYTNQKIIKGKKITKYDIICKRPAKGISPLKWNKVLGKRTKRNFQMDELILWKDLE